MAGIEVITRSTPGVGGWFEWSHLFDEQEKWPTSLRAMPALGITMNSLMQFCFPGDSFPLARIVTINWGRRNSSGGWGM